MLLSTDYKKTTKNSIKHAIITIVIDFTGETDFYYKYTILLEIGGIYLISSLLSNQQSKLYIRCIIQNRET